MSKAVQVGMLALMVLLLYSQLGPQVLQIRLHSKDPIVGFVFGQKGLLAGVSIEGTKFTKIWPDTGTKMDQDQEEIETFNERLTD